MKIAEIGSPSRFRLSLPESIKIDGFPPEIERQTKECDVILCVYDPKDYNNRNNLPNKLFLAMKLGKPIIVSKGTKAAEIVEKYGMGVAVDYSIAAVLDPIN